MLPLLFLCLLFIAILLVVVGVGMGLGFFLHWIIPAIDLGLCVLIGVISAAFSVYFAAWLVATVGAHAERDPEIEEVVLWGIGPRGSSKRKKRR